MKSEYKIIECQEYSARSIIFDRISYSIVFFYRIACVTFVFTLAPQIGDNTSKAGLKNIPPHHQCTPEKRYHNKAITSKGDINQLFN